LSLDFVVKGPDVGRNLSICDCGRGSEKYAEGGGREMHGSVSRCDEYVGLKKGETRFPERYLYLAEKTFSSYYEVI